MGRDPKHDYKSRCIYHITIGKAEGMPPFSRVSGTAESPLVERTAIGKIVEDQILNLSNLCRSLNILQYVIMPDHIHFAIFAREYLPRALGRYIGMMKVKTGQMVRELLPDAGAVFQEDFHDRILRRTHSLDTICRYIRRNPARLLARRENHDYFSKRQNIEINGTTWQAYGNLQLLQNPFKGPVVIHRRDSEALKEAKKRRWKHLSENGGVLISPFISEQEKNVRAECERLNGKVILLTNRPLKDREKPAAHNFEQCALGRLLILAPMKELPEGRATWLFLNDTAEKIALASPPNRR